MKTTHYIGLCYIVSIGAAGGVAYFRGKRGFELAKDATLYGGALGTTTIALSFISHIGSGLGGYSTKKQVAKTNFSPLRIAAKNTLGKLSKGGAQLLANLDTEKLYANMKESGVKVAPLPENPSSIAQDET